MLTTDGQLYRYTSTGFSTAVPTTALTGTITSTQIGANQITTGNLAVGAVTADTIASNAITSDKIEANSITSAKISAGAIGATQIAADAITATKIAAGAITANKIAALSIDATKIVAGSIGADQLAANSITAGKIVAGSISGSHIAAGTITSTNIMSGTITASQIASFAITSAKLDTTALTGHHAAFDASKGTVDASAVLGTGQNGVVVANGGLNTTCGIAGIGKNYGVVGEAKLSGSGNYSVLGWGRTVNTVGVVGNSNSYSGVIGDSTSGRGVVGITSTGVYGLSTNNKTYSALGYAPFTGVHEAYGADDYITGDIVYAIDTFLVDVSQSYVNVSSTLNAMDKRVFGVVAEVDDITKITKDNKFLCLPRTIKNGVISTVVYDKYKPEFEAVIANLINDGNKYVGVNSLGEGGINVCNEGGNIEIGDYICSSNTKGKGMKQDDDLLHNYTVAKALEAVDWSKETSTTKMIACTYHCG
jgi:hypothetical protein